MAKCDLRLRIFLYRGRLTDSGALDASFGNGGKQITDFGKTEDIAYGVVLDSRGRITVAGSTGADFGVVRLTDSGTLDTSFGKGGTQTIDFSGTKDSCYSVAADSEDNIILAGYSEQRATGWDFAIARLNVGGLLDTSIGIKGEQTIDFGGTNDVGHGVTLDSQGRIIAAGTTGADFGVARLTPLGALDESFGISGEQTVDFGGTNDYAYAIALDSQENVLVAGYSNQSLTGSDFAVAQLTSSGVLDSSFDGDGKQTVDFGGPNDLCYGVAIDNQDNVILAGCSQQGPSAYETDFAVAKLRGVIGPSELDEVIANTPPGGVVEVVGTPRNMNDWITAVAALSPNVAGNPITIIVTLSSGNYGPLNRVHVPVGFVVVIDGARRQVEVVGGSPALILGSGELIVKGGITLSNATDYATVVVEGGRLTLRDCMVEETIGGDEAAIEVFSGTVDLGTTASPGGNTLVINGAGQFIENRSAIPLLILGNTYAVEDETVFGPADPVIVGTPAAEQVKFKAGAKSDEIVASITGLPAQIITGAVNLVAYAGDGDDLIAVEGTTLLSAWLYGEEGNDKLNGGAGNDRVFGGPGDDLLVGQSGRDLMVGGWGSDRLVGNADDDILIAGATSLRETEVDKVMQRWTGVGTPAARRTDVLEYLESRPESVFIDDGEKDLLTGSAGTDWFIANLEGAGVLDKVTDLDDAVFATDLDFIMAS